MGNQGRYWLTSISARPRLMKKLAAPVLNLTSRTPDSHRLTVSSAKSLSSRHRNLIAMSSGNAYLTRSLIQVRFRQKALRSRSIWTRCSMIPNRPCSTPMSTTSVNWRRSLRNLPYSLFSRETWSRSPRIEWATTLSSTQTKTLNYISYNSWGCASSRPGKYRSCICTPTNTQSRGRIWQTPQICSS